MPVHIISDLLSIFPHSFILTVCISVHGKCVYSRKESVFSIFDVGFVSVFSKQRLSLGNCMLHILLSGAANLKDLAFWSFV